MAGDCPAGAGRTGLEGCLAGWDNPVGADMAGNCLAMAVPAAGFAAPEAAVPAFGSVVPVLGTGLGDKYSGLSAERTALGDCLAVCYFLACPCW